MRGGAVALPRDSVRTSRSLSLLRDDRVAARATKGDRAAFAEIYRRHHQRLFRYCLAILHDAEDAADALQTTMAKALSALEGGESVRGVRPWLFSIAHNTAIDTVRLRRPQVDLDELAETESSALTAPSAATVAEDRAELVQAVADIRDLPDRQAGALVMRELSGLSYPDIAAAFDTSAGNARQLVHGARTALHATRRGRDMDCEAVHLALGEADGRTPRDRRMRAHLASCEDCRAFQRSIRTRSVGLAVLAPPLAPWAAGDILGRLLPKGSGSGAGLAAGGGTAVGEFAKIAGASAAAKLGAGVAVVGTAVVAGGFVAAGGSLLDSAEQGGGSDIPGLLRPGTPTLGPTPKPLPATDREEKEEDAAASDTAAPVAAIPAAPPAQAPAMDPKSLSARGPVTRLEPAGDSAAQPAATVRDPSGAGGSGAQLADSRTDLERSIERPGLPEPPELPELPEPPVDRGDLPVDPIPPVRPQVPTDAGIPEIPIDLPDIDLDVRPFDSQELPAIKGSRTGSDGAGDGGSDGEEPAG